MRKVFLSLLFVISVLPLAAQSAQTYRWDAQTQSWIYNDSNITMPRQTVVYTPDNSSDYYFTPNSNYYYYAQPIYIVKPVVVLPKHEISLQICPYDVRNTMNNVNFKNLRQTSVLNSVSSVSPWDEITRDNIYVASHLELHALSLSYFYSANNNLLFGAVASFAYSETNYNEAFSRRHYGTISDAMFSISPSVRLNYVATKYCRMYIGVGYALMFASYRPSFNERRTKFASDWDVTLIGLSFGNRFFGGFEAGYEASGYCKFIFGYRF